MFESLPKHKTEHWTHLRMFFEPSFHGLFFTELDIGNFAIAPTVRARAWEGYSRNLQDHVSAFLKWTSYSFVRKYEPHPLPRQKSFAVPFLLSDQVGARKASKDAVEACGSLAYGCLCCLCAGSADPHQTPELVSQSCPVQVWEVWPLPRHRPSSLHCCLRDPHRATRLFRYDHGHVPCALSSWP
jgi:hypothetical protein